jgi:hypothetical protein
MDDDTLDGDELLARHINHVFEAVEQNGEDVVAKKMIQEDEGAAYLLAEAVKHYAKL